MIADFMSKPLQEALFKKFQDLIMGLETSKSDKAVSTKSGKVIQKKAKPNGPMATTSKGIGQKMI